MHLYFNLTMLPLFKNLTKNMFFFVLQLDLFEYFSEIAFPSQHAFLKSTI